MAGQFGLAESMFALTGEANRSFTKKEKEKKIYEKDEDDDAVLLCGSNVLSFVGVQLLCKGPFFTCTSAELPNAYVCVYEYVSLCLYKRVL